MESYNSITHITSNEHGQEEIEIVRDMRLMEIIFAIIKGRSFSFNKEITETFVRSRRLNPGMWLHKDTYLIADEKYQHKLNWLCIYMSDKTVYKN